MVRPSCSEEAAGLRAALAAAIPSASKSAFLQQKVSSSALSLALSRMDQGSGLAFLVSRLLKGICSSLLHKPVPPCLPLSSTTLPHVSDSQAPTCPATVLQEVTHPPILPDDRR